MGRGICCQLSQSDCLSIYRIVDAHMLRRARRRSSLVGLLTSMSPYIWHMKLPLLPSEQQIYPTHNLDVGHELPEHVTWYVMALDVWNQ